MLQVTLLKTNHCGAQEAWKTHQYIGKTQVYCPEALGYSTGAAKYFEKNWSKFLIEGTEAKLQVIWPNIGSSADDKRYGLTVFEYLFRSKVPVYYLERWTEQESGEINAAYVATKQQLQLGIVAAKADLDEHAENYILSAATQRSALVHKRDQHIAQNLEHVEERIRNRYRHLSKHNAISYCINIGATHSPEQYTNMPITVIDLTARSKLHEFPEIVSLIARNTDQSTIEQKIHEFIKQQKETPLADEVKLVAREKILMLNTGN